MHKRRMGLFLVLALLLGLRAVATPPDVAQLLATGKAKLEAAQRMAMEVQATLGIDPVLWPPKNFASLSAIYHQDPFKIKINGIIDDTVIDAYMLPKDEGAALYFQVNGAWYEQLAKSPEDALKKFGSSSPEAWAAYIGYLKNPNLAADTESYDGREVYKITATLSGEGLWANAAAYGLSGGEDADAVLRENNPICPFTLLIDVQTGSVLQMELDYSPFVALLYAAEGLEDTQGVHMIIQATFREIDADEDFDIPAEILSM